MNIEEKIRILREEVNYNRSRLRREGDPLGYSYLWDLLDAASDTDDPILQAYLIGRAEGIVVSFLSFDQRK